MKQDRVGYVPEKNECVLKQKKCRNYAVAI